MRTAQPLCSNRRPILCRLLAALLVIVGANLTVSAAHAAGTVTIADPAPTENNGRWKLQMTINFGSKPHINHIPMLFIFTPTAYFERTLTDQSPEKPVQRRVPLENQQSINESMDVGFSDASGKVFNLTKFDFTVRRDHGFEAGEYTLEVRLDDGKRIGSIQKLKLQGDNPVVDRRAMVFSGDKNKKTGGDAASKPSGENADKKTTEESSAAAPAAPPPSEPSEPAAGAAPPPVAPKQGGCGCRIAPESRSGVLVLPLLAVGAALFLRRRSRA